jgi:hypothetical protein
MEKKHKNGSKNLSDYQYLLYFLDVYKEVIADVGKPVLDRSGKPRYKEICSLCRWSKTCNGICRFWKVCNLCGEEKVFTEMCWDSLSRSSKLGICKSCRKEVNKHFNIVPHIKTRCS